MENQVLKLTQDQVRTEIDHINGLANNMQNAIEELDQAINNCMARGLETGWAQTTLAKMRGEQKTRVTEAIAEIKLQATKLAEIGAEAGIYSDK